MPGVLIVEAMAQTAAAYTAYVEDQDTTGKIILFMGLEQAKFRRPVVPGGPVAYSCEHYPEKASGLEIRSQGESGWQGRR